MSVTSRIDISALSFQAFAALVERALDAEHEAAINDVLDALAERTGSVVSGRHPGEISELRGDLARLRRRVQANSGRRAEMVASALHRFGLTLDSGLTSALMHDAAERRATARTVLRDRILQALAAHGAMRPSELAKQLDSGPSQISRCLKHLQEEQRIEAAPDASGDGRASAYQLRTTAPTAAAAA